MSRILPILFNTEMVQAILDRRKTVTRRLIKPQHLKVLNSPYHKKHPEVEDKTIIEKLCMPPCQQRDILYVRETWRMGAWDIRNQMIAFDFKDGTCGKLTYIRDRELFNRLVDQSREDARKAKCEYNGVDFVWEKGKSPCRWHPSIHMPKEAARIWLKVMDVRVERLQEMTASESTKEGIQLPKQYNTSERAYILKFADLWDSTIKKESIEECGWYANPWVWVIEFERCKKPEAQSK